MSLIVDETEFANTLVRQSLEKVFKQTDLMTAGLRTINWDIKLDIQSFSRKTLTGGNRTVDYSKVLQTAARSARG